MPVVPIPIWWLYISGGGESLLLAGHQGYRSSTWINASSRMVIESERTVTGPASQCISFSTLKRWKKAFRPPWLDAVNWTRSTRTGGRPKKRAHSVKYLVALRGTLIVFLLGPLELSCEVLWCLENIFIHRLDGGCNSCSCNTLVCEM